VAGQPRVAPAVEVQDRHARRVADIVVRQRRTMRQRGTAPQRVTVRIARIPSCR
jgi:hypothetical protein